MSRRHPMIVFAVGLVTWVTAGVVQLIASPPLGHDEAQYALALKGALHGGRDRWIYLSKGMYAVAAPGYAAGGSDLAMRIAPFLFGIAFVLAAAQLARRWFGPTTAAWTVLVLATAKPVVRHSVDLLSDLPATACLLAGTSLLVGELLREDGPRWRMWATAPLFAAAFYVRYASCVPIALIGVVALAVGWRAVMRRPGPAVATFVAFAVLMLPHALSAWSAYGSPLAILLESKEVPQSTVSGLRTYFTSNPLFYFGVLLAPAAILGALSLRPSSDRKTVALWLIGVGDILGIGLVALGQARYVLFGLVLLAILGVELVRRLVEARSSGVQRVVVGVAALAGALTAVLAVTGAMQQSKHHERAIRPTVEMAAAIAKDTVGHGCYFIANHYTQIEWYSGCDGDNFEQAPALARGDHIYYAWDDSGGWQPGPEELARPHHVIFERGKLLVIRVER